MFRLLLLAKASPRARYLEVRGENHLTLPMRIDGLGATVDDWFAELPARGRQSGPEIAPVQALQLARN